MNNNDRNEYYTFNSKQAKVYGKYLWKKWKNQLSRKEKLVLFQYKAFNNLCAKKINKELRNKEYSLWERNFSNGSKADIIENALNKSVLDRNIILYRNTNEDFLKANDRTIETLKVNDVLIDKGFMSTSLYQYKLRFKSKVLFIIRCPKGTKGGYMDHLCISWREREILLNRDSILIVRKISKEDNRLIVVADYY